MADTIISHLGNKAFAVLGFGSVSFEFMSASIPWFDWRFKGFWRALLRLMEGRTAFVIAHRLSTIRNADQVLVVNENRIIERGTHEELLGMEGFYWILFMSQYSRVS